MTMTSYTKRCTSTRRVCWCKFEWNPTRSFCVICILVSLSLVPRQGLSLDFACLFMYSLAISPELFVGQNAETLSHTHKLLGYLMWAQVWDGHMEGQKNPDRLKRIIHVDRIGVHSTFVYIYAVLRVLMIWANYFFLLTCLFFLEK